MKGYTILLLLFLCPCFVSAQDLVVKGIVLPVGGINLVHT